jgi:hypothetical protein
MYSKALNPPLGFVKRLKQATKGDFDPFFVKMKIFFENSCITN